ncbi:hypothetical protein [Gordonia aurantiaca]|uniref:hypothetical protein n=1 Tax=Gordonia sp. B21 TaxID=3151852 RepID=UPI003265B941
MTDAHDPTDRGRADVEKRWQDTGTYRSAALYVLAVVAVAAVVCAIFLSVARDSVVVGALIPGVFFLGGVGALVTGYRSYRKGGTWPMWQGAGWFLFALMLVTLAFPTMAT